VPVVTEAIAHAVIHNGHNNNNESNNKKKKQEQQQQQQQQEQEATSGVLLRAADEAQQVTGVLLEDVYVHQRLDVDGQEVVAQRHGGGLAGDLVHAGDCGAERAGLEGGGQQLHHGRPGITL
jgi:hypothetical protein